MVKMLAGIVADFASCNQMDFVSATKTLQRLLAWDITTDPTKEFTVVILVDASSPSDEWRAAQEAATYYGRRYLLAGPHNHQLPTKVIVVKPFGGDGPLRGRSYMPCVDGPAKAENKDFEWSSVEDILLHAQELAYDWS